MEKNLEEQMVLQQSIKSARCEEEAMHCMMHDSFEILREDRVRHSCMPRRKVKKVGRAVHVPQFPADELAELWMIALARCRATFEVEASGTSVQCADDAEALGSE
jgi:hypothetical protein